jgi:hypothetical protein
MCKNAEHACFLEAVDRTLHQELPLLVCLNEIPEPRRDMFELSTIIGNCVEEFLHRFDQQAVFAPVIVQQLGELEEVGELVGHNIGRHKCLENRSGDRRLGRLPWRLANTLRASWSFLPLIAVEISA